MGQTWSTFMSGHMGVSNNPPAPEACPTPSPSQATTEASSSVPVYQGGPFSVSAADVELSSLKDEGSDEHQERGKEMQTTPTPSPSTSQQQSPLQAFLKGPEKAQIFKKSQASPSLTSYKFGTLKMVDQKPRAFKQPRISTPPAITRLSPQHYASELETNSPRIVTVQEELSTPSPSQFSPSLDPEDEGLQLAKMDADEETLSQSMLPEPEEHSKMETTKEGEELMQPPHSSAQRLLLFELDRKRKAPAGLPSLAVECMGASRMKLKARTSLEKLSEGGSREAVLDFGTGDAMIGRRVKKAIGSRGICQGHVSSYDVPSRLYQIEYENGKEEAMEWLALEPCLMDRSKNTSAPVEEIKGTKALRKSLRNAPRVKKVEEFVYTKRKARGRRRKN